ncbi:MATE family efflux transporter [Roseibium sp. RP-7]
MSSDISRPNAYTHGPILPTLARTALPIILVMSMNGLLTVVDAIFLGLFVGPDALSAVTLMFPAYMLLAALATLVASGMSSVLARKLGAGLRADAEAVFAGAHGLALAIAGIVVALFLGLGDSLTRAAADGSAEIAGMSHTYMAITVAFTPLMFVLSVNADALRNEGLAVVMAGFSLLVSLANIAFDYLLIAVYDYGVAGSAAGTVLAQALALAIMLGLRLSGKTELSPSALLRYPLTSFWRDILMLGAPQSLSFIGIALGSAATIAALQTAGASGYEATVAAFGIVTRVMTFCYLPLLGLAQALQSMIGNNFGAGLWHRSDSTLRAGLVVALVYCGLAELVLTLFSHQVGFAFVDDPGVAAEVGRILPVIMALYFVAGPLFMVATYFQALGDAARAALLSLAKPYAFFLPLVFLMPVYFGEGGIWLSSPLAELMLLVVTLVLLGITARTGTARWGLFRAVPAN